MSELNEEDEDKSLKRQKLSSPQTHFTSKAVEEEDTYDFVALT